MINVISCRWKREGAIVWVVEQASLPVCPTTALLPPYNFAALVGHEQGADL